jgi:hypothetical protein
MRQLIASFALLGAIGPLGPALASNGEPAAGKAGIRACSLLTKDLLTQHSPFEQAPPAERDQHRMLLGAIPPEEESIGPSGSACSFGGVYLQVDPFAAPAKTEADVAKMSTRVAGVGDVAYFRNNRGEYAELYVRSGVHVITLQMDTPQGRTPESIKPNAIALAQAILPKLR